MPVYTYRCKSCGLTLEHYQQFTDKPLTRCPECGKKTLKKVYTPVGIVFKGSGFYATDHHSPSGQTPATADKNGESKETGPAKDKEKGPAQEKEKTPVTDKEKSE